MKENEFEVKLSRLNNSILLLIAQLLTTNSSSSEWNLSTLRAQMQITTIHHLII